MENSRDAGMFALSFAHGPPMTISTYIQFPATEATEEQLDRFVDASTMTERDGWEPLQMSISTSSTM